MIHGDVICNAVLVERDRLREVLANLVNGVKGGCCPEMCVLDPDSDAMKAVVAAKELLSRIGRNPNA